MMNMENINNMLVSSIESAAQLSVGQAVLRIIDRIMWIIEKSVQWSLPEQEVTADENGKTFGKVELVRPLPWILFLPSLIMLRMVRFGIDMTAGILGYPQLEPSQMVRIIQRGRRRLRTIKMTGLKSMRQKKITVMKTSPVTEDKVSNESSKAASPTHLDAKRKYSELSSDESDEETLVSKLDRLANESGSDKDFNPSDCTSGDESATSESEADVSISSTEVHDLQTAAEELMKTSSCNPNCNDKLCDNELNKPKNEEPTSAIHSNQSQYESKKYESDEEEIVEREETCVNSNGTGVDLETAYYSPISWKSISPEPLIMPENQDQIDADVEYDSTKSWVKASETNGNLKEKEKSMTNSSDSNKHNNKKKRGNHGNRKKK